MSIQKWNYWQVQATHKYVGEDLDELTFEPDEIITVVPFDDPEEQVQMITYFMRVFLRQSFIHLNRKLGNLSVYTILTLYHA